MCMQCMATAMTAGAAVTGTRAWIVARRPAWITARRLKRGTAAILALGVLLSGAHLAPNGSGTAVARAAAGSQSAASPEGAVDGAGPLDRVLLTVLTAAKATDAFKAIEGSLVYLSAKYETQVRARHESQTEGTGAVGSNPRSKKSSPQEAGVGGGSPLPPASAGTNGTPIPPPPPGVGNLIAQAPAPSGSAAATATYVSGIALAPASAPERIAGAINAANTIVGRPYIWGGGHGSWYSRGYDCSGAVSFALAGGGFITSPLTSTQLASWGEPGPGRWLTIYANPSHAYAVIAGLRWDTVGDARGTGPRWHLAGQVPDGYVARHPPGY